MQGRLSPRGSGPIQFFPFDTWQQEFSHAAEIGLDEIEFIFDAPRFVENPLWTDKGVRELLSVMRASGVAVRTICADFFMARPFFRTDRETLAENISVLEKLIGRAKEIGANGIEIPLVDNSSIKTKAEEDILVSVIKGVLPLAKRSGVFIGLETDLPPATFRALLMRFDDPYLRANYDTGNSSGLGFDPEEELRAYGEFIANIHIKDRMLGGTTVPLGTGSARFEAFFKTLGSLGYAGSFILQAARGEDGKERETVAGQKAFVEGLITRYLR